MKRNQIIQQVGELLDSVKRRANLMNSPVDWTLVGELERFCNDMCNVTRTPVARYYTVRDGMRELRRFQKHEKDRFRRGLAAQLAESAGMEYKPN